VGLAGRYAAHARLGDSPPPQITRSSFRIGSCFFCNFYKILAILFPMRLILAGCALWLPLLCLQS
jgi:hypothetical protein